MQPMMSATQTRCFERELLRLANPRLDVLEWGCGGSTYYYTQFLERHGIPYSWTSIEHKAEWADMITQALAAKTNVKIFTKTDWDEYVGFPATLGRQFDLILVDGRQRQRCLQQAHMLVKTRGVVLLHDATRTRYRGGFARYSDVRFLCYDLMRGTLQPLSPLRRFTNALNRAFYYAQRPFRKLAASIRKRLNSGAGTA